MGEEFLDMSYKHPRKVIVHLGQLAEWAAKEFVDVNQLEVSVSLDGREYSFGDDEVLSLKVEVTNPADTTCAGFVNLLENLRCCRYARRTGQALSVVFVVFSMISFGFGIWLKCQSKSLELPTAIAQTLPVAAREMPKWCLAGFMFLAFSFLAVCCLCFGTCCRPYQNRLLPSVFWTCPVQCDDEANMPLIPAESDDDNQIEFKGGYQLLSGREFTEMTEYSLP